MRRCRSLRVTAIVSSAAAAARAAATASRITTLGVDPAPVGFGGDPVGQLTPESRGEHDRGGAGLGVGLTTAPVPLV